MFEVVVLCNVDNLTQQLVASNSTSVAHYAHYKCWQLIHTYMYTYKFGFDDDSRFVKT